MKTDLLEMLVMVNRKKPLKAARDRAFLLIGFAGALRLSELVAIQCADITRFEAGMEVNLPRSKTDQEGVGRTVWIPHAKDSQRCRVAALEQWLALSVIDRGPVFRWVSRQGNLVGTNGLTSQSVALVVKRSVTRVHGTAATKAVSGHSLRAGLLYGGGARRHGAAADTRVLAAKRDRPDPVFYPVVSIGRSPSSRERVSESERLRPGGANPHSRMRSARVIAQAVQSSVAGARGVNAGLPNRRPKAVDSPSDF
ncbi:hypothetical protein ACSFBI_30940 [Variovorax sp. RB3P1]|uniref:hypothetical protein n=1 Tax=Variovorax sp. RB3P1 TaxID=3443732 RepID=UPI003F4619D0